MTPFPDTQGRYFHTFGVLGGACAEGRMFKLRKKPNFVSDTACGKSPGGAFAENRHDWQWLDNANPSCESRRPYSNWECAFKLELP